MAFLTVNADEENIRDYDGDGSAYIQKSGIYDVIIKNVIVDQTDKGSQFINLWIDHQGKEQPIFQAMRLTNNDGSDNLGKKAFNKFCIVAGLQAGEEITDPVSVMVPIGKGGEEKKCMVLEQFNDTPMTIRIQMEYTLYDGKIRESKSIRNFFRYEDKATASEIVNDVENKGEQFQKEQEYADKVSYKDGLTEEDVAQYLKDRKSGSKDGEKDKKPANGFGQKRTFGKK